MDVARMARNMISLSGNLYFAKMNPAKDEVSKMLTVDMEDTNKLFKKKRRNGAAFMAST